MSSAALSESASGEGLRMEGVQIPTVCEARYSQSLGRGLAVLSCFSAEHPVLGIYEIADELGMSRSTTHRYVITLLSLGYLIQCQGRKYRLAVGVLDLGLSAFSSVGLRQHAHELLVGLRDRSSYTVSLAVLDGEDVLYVDRVRSRRRGQERIDLGTRVGSRHPVYCTAAGKVLLLGLPEVYLEGLIRALEPTALGPNTITSKRTLREELALLAETRFAVADEELADGLVAVAAPVRDQARETVAAVSLAAHRSMISAEALVERLGSELLSTADDISARLGYRRDDERWGAGRRERDGSVRGAVRCLSSHRTFWR